MNDDQKFWYSIWRLFAVLICVLAVSAAGCTMHSKNKLSEMVKNGVDPIIASCAMGGAGSLTSNLCVQIIASK
jgi:hypothetical protein